MKETMTETEKVFTFKFTFTANGKEDSAEFCAHSVAEAERFFEEWFLNENESNTGEIPFYEVEVVYNEEDADDYGNRYGTPEDHNRICHYCRPYSDGTYAKEKHINTDNNTELDLIASDEALMIDLKPPAGSSNPLPTAAKFCPYCGRRFEKKA